MFYILRVCLHLSAKQGDSRNLQMRCSAMVNQGSSHFSLDFSDQADIIVRIGSFALGGRGNSCGGRAFEPKDERDVHGSGQAIEQVRKGQIPRARCLLETGNITEFDMGRD